MPDKLRHRKTALADVLVKGPVRKGAFGRDQMDVRFLPQPFAQVAELRDFLARDGEFALGVGGSGLAKVFGSLRSCGYMPGLKVGLAGFMTDP